MASLMMNKSSMVRPARASRSSVVVRAEAKDLWFPGAARPSYLTGTLAGDRGFDPLGLGADPVALKWYQQSELIHARSAMAGVAGILVQEIVHPDLFWYTSSQPQYLPGPWQNVNMGGLLAIHFVLIHWVELRRWADYKNFGSVNGDPIFKNNKVSNPEMGYPGFDPLGFAKGDFTELKTKEIKNGRLAMIAFAGFTIQAQATGKGPIADLFDHLSNPFGNNLSTNIGHCVIPPSVDVQGLTIPLTCLWPGHA